MIGIISSGTENYNLIKLCHQYNIPFQVYADTRYRPYQDKSIETITSRLDSLIQQALNNGCTSILLSPVYELYYTHRVNTYNDNIVPLFHSYLKYTREHSLVGKIGYFGGYTDAQLIDNSLHDLLAKSYTLTSTQQTTKPFLTPLRKRSKDVSMRTFFSRFYSNRQMMINKIIKFDLRYFKDANVDTLIPLSYEYFNYQRTIINFFNQKKQKFHKRNTVRELFAELVSGFSSLKNKNNTEKESNEIYIYTTGSPHLLQQKRHEIIVSAGGEYKIIYKNI